MLGRLGVGLLRRVGELGGGGVEKFKSTPHVSKSHPFVERLIGSIRRELLDHTFYWSAPGESSSTIGAITTGPTHTIYWTAQHL